MGSDEALRRGGPRPGMSDAQRDEETRQMLLLKQSGASYEAIGRQFGLSASAVWRKIKGALDKVPLPEATYLRSMEVRKLDDWELRLREQISQGDTKAINTAVRISERRCRMLGLDMPVRSEVMVSAAEQQLAAEFMAVVDQAVELAARQAEEEQQEMEDS